MLNENIKQELGDCYAERFDDVIILAKNAEQCLEGTIKPADFYFLNRSKQNTILIKN